jgi:hypothetical protein
MAKIPAAEVIVFVSELKNRLNIIYYYILDKKKMKS